MFHANATQRWRYPKVLQSDPLLQCALCIDQVLKMSSIFSGLGSHTFSFCKHTVTGNHQLSMPDWAIFYLNTFVAGSIGGIFLEEHYFGTYGYIEPSNTQVFLACKVWAQMCLYMRIDFNTLRRKLHSANPEQSSRLQMVFTRAWGIPP
jgi:hypothetical protein